MFYGGGFREKSGDMGDVCVNKTRPIVGADESETLEWSEPLSAIKEDDAAQPGTFRGLVYTRSGAKVAKSKRPQYRLYGKSSCYFSKKFEEKADGMKSGEELLDSLDMVSASTDGLQAPGRSKNPGGKFRLRTQLKLDERIGAAKEYCKRLDYETKRMRPGCMQGNSVEGERCSTVCTDQTSLARRHNFILGLPPVATTAMAVDFTGDRQARPLFRRPVFRVSKSLTRRTVNGTAVDGTTGIDRRNKVDFRL
ncbi:hypothetical protein B0H10DRAFT_1954864 [Mycena sp. CBHHK59/15]|nr:hypothetical protein B0H10DRAFT_1954864 [Mycena sp. CBHHK59/15]